MSPSVSREDGDKRKRLIEVMEAQRGGQSAATLSRLSGLTPIKTRQQLNRLEKLGRVIRDERDCWTLK